MPILAAIDETERAKEIVSLANDLATAYDDSLVVLHVIPREDYETHRDEIRDVPGFGNFSMSQEADSAAGFAQQLVSDTLDAPTVDVQARGRIGDVAEETLAEAANVDPRYLVIGGRRRSPTGKALFGSSTQQILLNADCPVVTKMGE